MAKQCVIGVISMKASMASSGVTCGRENGNDDIIINGENNDVINDI